MSPTFGLATDIIQLVREELGLAGLGHEKVRPDTVRTALRRRRMLTETSAAWTTLHEPLLHPDLEDLSLLREFEYSSNKTLTRATKFQTNLSCCPILRRSRDHAFTT